MPRLTLMIRHFAVVSMFNLYKLCLQLVLVTWLVTWPETKKTMQHLKCKPKLE